MFKKIGDQITYPSWVDRDPRYKRLDQYDKLLDGTFYDHLVFAFYDETDKGPSAELVRIDQRRPSAQFKLPRMVARWCSRKLFAGRHIPRIHHPDKQVAAKVTQMVKQTKFWRTMLAAVLRGSVGSVAVTFNFEEEYNAIGLAVWRARDCVPKFDATGELAELRIQYQVSRSGMIAAGFADAQLKDGENRFWYIRDLTRTKDVVYMPVPVNEWNPVDGFVGDDARTKRLIEFPDRTKEHNYGFVTGHWFQNLSGGNDPDGACTFEDAIPNSIELDYTLSQIGRGVRYNASPTLVLIGDVENPVVRGPMHYVHIKGGFKQEGGDTTTNGDAKLLEMNGAGTTAALTLIDKLRNFALEQISANRKDAEKMKGPLSGRAMEFLDEDSLDLVMELRSSYGDEGALCLIRKMGQVFLNIEDLSQLKLRWPRLYQPTPAEIAQLLPALVAAVYPETSAGGGGEGVAPAPLPGILTLEEAQAYIKMNMDMDVRDDDSDDDAESEDVEEGDASPDSNVPLNDHAVVGDPQASPESGQPTDGGPPEGGDDIGA